MKWTGILLLAVVGNFSPNSSGAIAGDAPAWQRDLPVYDPGQPGEPRWLRTLIHIHSVFSHDACDGKPQKKGKLNRKCLESFREALCRNHVDVTFLTEHKKKMGQSDFNIVMAPQPGDVPIEKDGQVIGVVQSCPDGHRVTVFPGSETSLMSFGLLKHPEMAGGDTYAAYGGSDPAAVARFRAAGALVGIPHTEEKTLDQLKWLEPDTMEVYNLHANLSGLLDNKNPAALMSKAYQFIHFFSSFSMEPDLVFLNIFQEDKDSLLKWSQYTAHGKALTGTLGTDAHENTFFNKMNDGERVDGYRRMTRWFANYIQVPSRDVVREEVMDSLKAGRTFMAFDVFGTPQGFSFKAESRLGSYGMGDRIIRDRELPVYFEATMPQIVGLDPSLPAPQMRLRILRASINGWQLVGETTGEKLRVEARVPGTFRAEVRMVPKHLKPYLNGSARNLIRDVPWVYSNPIYIE